MANVVFRGKAAFEGIAGTFDVIIYPVKQTGKLTQNFEAEDIKDEHGFDVSTLARNTHHLFDVGMKLLGDTAAHAASGGTFLAPLATVTLTGFGIPAIPDGTKYQYVSGADIDLGNTKVGDFAIKLRRYEDATQNSLMTSTPS